jgi:hypothetical protein
MVRKSNNSYYIITYRDPQNGEVVSLKANKVTDSSLGLSFIAVSDFIFDTNTLVVNPAAEDQKKRFESVKTIHISIYTIVSIEEAGLKNKGLKFDKDKSNLVVLSNNQQPSKN